MDRFLSWIKWHGPYRSRSAFKKAIESFEKSSNRARLYLAVGRLKRFSITRSQTIYLGMNGLDSGNSLAERSADSLFEGNAHTICGLMNEYWFGEVLIKFNAEETASHGVVHDTEKALIYTLNPIMCKHHTRNIPFSYRLFNEFKVSWENRMIGTRLQTLLKPLVDYDQASDSLSTGKFNFKLDKKFKLRAKKRWKNPRRDCEKNQWFLQRLKEDDSMPIIEK